jgi:hypothetical protein
MADKTREQLETELKIIEAIAEARKVSDEVYAIKLVEKIVFGMIAFILLAVIGAIIALVII